MVAIMIMKLETDLLKNMCERLSNLHIQYHQSNIKQPAAKYLKYVWMIV